MSRQKLGIILELKLSKNAIYNKKCAPKWKMNVNSQNKIISFEDTDFWPKIYLFLYPSLENTTTHKYIPFYGGAAEYYEKKRVMIFTYDAILMKDQSFRVLQLGA